MNNLVLKTKYLVLALLVTFSFSCSTEDGEQGPQGEQGIAGIDGIDGNANVQNITFDTSGFEGSFDTASIPELTQDVIDNDAILTYLLDSSNNWTTVPCPADSFGFDYAVDVNLSVGTVTFDYSDGSGAAVGITAGNIISGRIVIIASTTSSKTASKHDAINELNQAGVNIKDYYAVCDYYGIPY